MKVKIISFVFILLFINLLFAGGEEYRSSKKIVSIQAPVLVDFEDQATAAKWIIGNSTPNIDKDITGVKVITGGPWGLAVPENQKKSCLGVKTGFKSRGYNFVEILPPVYQTELYPGLQSYFMAPIPNPNNERFIPIPGKADSIDIWVAGRGYRYMFEIWLKDFYGFVYPLEMGKLDYGGWRNLSREIPGYILQETRYFPKEKPLKVVKFVLSADPDEIADKLFVYIDHMKVITDVYIERIDGDELRDSW